MSAPSVPLPAHLPVFDLWPEGIPDLKADASEARVVDGRVENVHRPTLTVYAPTAGTNPGTAVVVCAGGGYRRLAIGEDGGADVRWLNGLGVTAFVLMYRLADYGHPAPLRDILRAVRLVRSRAGEFNLHPGRIGVLGTSAGGHLAACASTLWDSPEGKMSAALDEISARPDFTLLIYPVVTMREPFAHRGSRAALLGGQPSPEAIAQLSIEAHVRTDSPPMFLVAAATDESVPVENSLLLYQAARAAAVPAELHLYAQGVHGDSRNPIYGPVSLWPDRAEDWLRFNGWLPAKS